MVLSNDIKKAIAFGLIVGAIISIFSVFGYCAEEEELSFIVVDNLALSATGFRDVEGAHIGYIQTEVGYMYRFENTSIAGIRYICFSNDLASSSTTPLELHSVSGSTTYTFYGRDGYLYFNVNNTSGSSKIYRTKLEGLPNFVDSIAYSLSYVNLNNIVANVVPILAIGVLLGLGFYLLKRVINKMKKAKGGI